MLKGHVFKMLFYLIRRWESFNKIHGRSSNPYDSNRIVGGSSGGEGAIQAGES